MTGALDADVDPCEEGASNPREPIMQPEFETHSVDPARLQHGCWSEEHQQTIGEGDIVASYSADSISTTGRIRKPFEYKGRQWVCVGTRGRGDVSEARAYRLSLAAHFANATTYSYGEKVSIGDGEFARNDVNGFYHAMKVQAGGQAMVLCGPPALFVADEAQRLAQQLDLF
jgi:hypothetical protein